MNTTAGGIMFDPNIVLVQILMKGDELLGLSKDGRIYRLDEKRGEWIPMSMKVGAP